MEQIQNFIDNEFPQKDNEKNKNSNNKESQQDESLQVQCQLCLKPYSRENHPMKICINDHNMCASCVSQKLFKQQKITYHHKQRIVYLCPFCYSLIDFSALVKNYKLMIKIFHKQTKVKVEQQQDDQAIEISEKQLSCQSSSLFQQLSLQNYLAIMKFISEKDKIQLVSTCLFLRSLLMNGQLWGQFQISDCLSMNIKSEERSILWRSRISWIEKYFTVIKPIQVKMIIIDFYEDQSLVSLFLKDYPWITKFTLFCESMEVHLAIAKSCREVTSLTVSSAIFCDQLFEEMVHQMKKIKYFSVIKDDVNFTCKNLSKHFSSGLQSIVLKPHMIQFEEISLLAQNNPQSLIQLQLDIQQCQEQILLSILEPLSSIEILKLYHMQNIHIPKQLAKSLSSKVRQLYLTKAYQMPMDLIIEKIATPKLLTIDFTEVNMLSDKNIFLVSENCPYLKRLNVSWCNKVTDQSLKVLIRKCKGLQYLNITGIKNLSDKVFEEYFELIDLFDEHKYDAAKHTISKFRHYKHQNNLPQFKINDFVNSQSIDSFLNKTSQITSLKCVKQVNCVSCNGISDKILKLIYIINRKASVINYYSSPMGLYAFDQIDNEIW